MTITRTRLASGATRRTQVRTEYFPDLRLPAIIREDGDLAVAGDERCTTLYYAANPGLYMLSYVGREAIRVGASCAGLVQDRRILYDGHADFDAPVTRGDPTRTQAWTGSSWVETAATFDVYGRATSATDPKGHTTTTAYAPATGLPTTVTVTNPLGHATTSQVNRERGQPTVVTDPNGHATTYQYDLLGRVTRVWQPTEPTSGPASWEFAYSIPRTAPAVIQTRQLQSGDDSAVYLNSFTLFDGQLRARETQTPSPAGGRIVSGTRYNTRGLVATVSLPFHNAGAPGSGLANPATFAAENLTKYDELGRAGISIFLSGGTERWRSTTVYGGNTVTVTPPGRSATKTTLDAYGRVVTVEEGPELARTAYGHDPTTGDLLRVTDSASPAHVTTIAYDALGRKTSMTDPDMGTWSYTYDPAGNLVTQTDARGQVAWFGYDDLNRRTSERRDSSRGQLRAAWTYDAAGYLGLPESSTSFDADRNHYVERSTAYDARSRPTEQEWEIATEAGSTGGTYRMTYGYDAADHPTTVRYPGNNSGGLGETVTTTYDGFGRPFSLAGTTTYIATTVYSPVGQLASQALGAITRTWEYEADTQRLHRRAATTAAGPLQDLTYSWLASGEVNTIVDAVADELNCLYYDPRGRLTAERGGADDCITPGYHNTFAYDSIGNITSLTTQEDRDPPVTRTYAYDPNHPHAATAAGPDTYAYDANGNMTTRTVGGGTQTLTWDHANRVSEIVEGADSSTYAYTASGERIRRSDGDTTTIYLGGIYEATATGGGPVTVTKHYLFGGQRVATRVGSTLHYILTDHLGSTSVTYKANGSDTRTQHYYAYGAPRPGPGNTLPTDRTYTGQIADAETGLMYYGARYYDPTLACFISADTITAGIGSIALNRYAYANNNPANHTDPTGHDVDGSPWDARRERRFLGTSAAIAQMVFGSSWDVGSRAPAHVGVRRSGSGAWESGGPHWSSVLPPPFNPSFWRGFGGAGIDLAKFGFRQSGVGMFVDPEGAQADLEAIVGIPGAFKDNPGGFLLAAIDWETWKTDPGQAAGAASFDILLTVLGGRLLRFGNVAPRAADNFVDLASPARRTHILHGDATGGGHLWPGQPGKTPFPRSWSGDRIIHEISDITTDPVAWRNGVPQGSRTVLTGTRGGVDIRVVVDSRTGEIITGYPTNLPGNP